MMTPAIFNAFFAVLPSDTAAQHLSQALTPVQEQLNSKCKWIKPIDYHVTLVYMRQLNEEILASLTDIVSHFGTTQPFELTAIDIEQFNQAYVIKFDTPAHIVELYQECLSAVQAVQPDLKLSLHECYTPHITFARADSRSKSNKVLETLRDALQASIIGNTYLLQPIALMRRRPTEDATYHKVAIT